MADGVLTGRRFVKRASLRRLTLHRMGPVVVNRDFLDHTRGGIRRERNRQEARTEDARQLRRRVVTLRADRDGRRAQLLILTAGEIELETAGDPGVRTTGPTAASAWSGCERCLRDREWHDVGDLPRAAGPNATIMSWPTSGVGSGLVASRRGARSRGGLGPETFANTARFPDGEALHVTGRGVARNGPLATSAKNALLGVTCTPPRYA
jgi:hypothetical protein